MRAFLLENHEHFLCGLLLFAKLGDNISTWLVTPTLRLEANPIARRLRWPFVWATLLICLLPYYNTTLAVVALPSFLLVAASNFGKVWMARVLGEDEVQRLWLAMAKRSSLGMALWPVAVAALYVSVLGALLIFLSPDPASDWSFWIGLGIVVYPIIIILHTSQAYVRLFRRARAEAL